MRGSPNLTLLLSPSSDTHAVLLPLEELQAGEYAVTVFVSDYGIPVLSAYAQVNVTVCVCDSFGDCKSEAGAVLGSSMGISFIALVIIMASIALLLCKCRLESSGLKILFFFFCKTRTKQTGPQIFSVEINDS